MNKALTPLAVLALCLGTPSVAYESHVLSNASGKPVVEVRFYGPTDGKFAEEEGKDQFSAWSWQPHIKEQVLKGVDYWAQIIQPQGDKGPAILNAGTVPDEGNAWGSSPQANQETDSRTAIQRHLQGLPVDPRDMVADAHAFYGLGLFQFPEEHRFSQIPLSDTDLVAISLHEVAHGLGAMSLTENEEDGVQRPRFASTLVGWTPLMVDDHGRPARPGQAILCDFCHNPYDPDAFDARDDRAVLVGPNIAEVLDGGLPGVPISMYGYYGDVRSYDSDAMSHSELKHSIMSHQDYRNYEGFMEAELAIMQDIGYTIDRRNFFGRSVYGSGLNIVNDRGFFARNAQGTEYLVGQANRSILGLGLHVYGSYNHIRQTADLLAAGEGGAGIRVDGEGNTIVIDPGVRVHANGLGGQGVMFTYGRHHTLVQRGDVEALGPHGVGLRFDFGNNPIGNDSEYRGSYIHTLGGEPREPAPELRGPLVSQADITGRVAGSVAAIHMGVTGYVGSVNVMQGARIEGDIVSHYAQRDETGARRITQVSFGQQADAQGRSTGVADAEFRMAYSGSIRGRENLVLSFDGGETVLNGAHQVVGVTVRPEATLAGSSAFHLADDGLFRNEGRLAPGNSIGMMAIAGDFQQTHTGRLNVDFNAAGEHDVVAVSGTVDLAGTLEMVPEEGWYGNSWSMQAQPIVTPAPVAGGFESVQVADVSPTLEFSARLAGGAHVVVESARAADAYSRHGTNDNARAAGRALEASLDALPAAMQPFMVAMDFSAPDGSGVARALDLASPQGYSAGLAASLLRERDVMETALRGFGDGLRNAQGSEWKGFAVAFGSDGRQDNRDSMIGYDATTYGLVIGGGRTLASNPDIAVGVHLDVAEQRVKLDSPQWGKGDTTAFGLGAQLQYQPDPMAGAHAHAGFRLGIEHGSMDRKVAVGSYYASHSSDWTGHSASVQAGGGYRFPLSSTVSVGPIATLNYARVSRPGVDESGPEATRLALDGRNIDALRSSLGVAAVMHHTLENGSTLRAHAEASWDHEWLDRDVVQTARFAAVSGPTFQSRNAVLPRNSLGLRAGLQWQRSDRFSVGAGLGGRLGNGYKSLEGQVSLRWAF